MDHIFISHAEEDAEIAVEIAQHLEDVGFSTWYYQRDTVPGTSYLTQVTDAIKQCGAVILIISQESVNSNQVSREVVSAFEKGKTFIPVLSDISYKEFQERQQEWQHAIAGISSIGIGADGVSAIIPRIIEGLKTISIQLDSKKTSASPTPAKQTPDNSLEKIIAIIYITNKKKYYDVISNLVKEFNGNLLDSSDEDQLVEFDSAIDAVECASKINEEFKLINADLSKSRRIDMRIGIYSGDVAEDAGIINGNGVNIASRLEELAKGGGIFLSRNIYEQVKNKMDLEFEYIGEQAVKNITEPVHVYRLHIGPEDSIFHFSKNIEMKLPEKPSIAVLTFDNMSGDPANDCLCDGITEAIITGLASIPLMFVIARNSTNAYKGKSINVQQIGRELGVKYVLEGSANRSGDRIRIIAQLIDATTGRHLWADRYDTILDDIFTFQDDITVRILSALQMKLERGHKTHIRVGVTNNLNALEKYCHAYELMYRHANFEDAAKLLSEVIELDPDFALPYVFLGWCLMIDFWLGLSEIPEKSMETAYELTKKAIQLNDSLAPAYTLLGKITYTMGEYDKGIELGRKAVTINRNEADCHANLGCILTYSGYPEEALYWISKAVRLNPVPTYLYLLYFGQAYNILGRYEEAIEAYTRVVDFLPDMFFAHIGLAESYSLLGKKDKARHAAEDVYRVYPLVSAQYHVKAMAYRNKADTDRVLKALQDAGIK